MLARIFSAFALLVATFADASAAEVKDIRWGTGPVGSAGHKALVLLAGLLTREMPQYRIIVLPTPGAVTTVKGYAIGEYDGFYGSDVAFDELAANDRRFKGFKAQMKRQPVQSFWAYTIEGGFAVRNGNGAIKSWSDLTGKRVFTGPLAFDVRAQLERALAALDVHHDYVQADLSTVGSQLASSAIDAMTVYTASEATPPPWLVEASLAVDWAAVNPSPQEIAKLKAKNFEVFNAPPALFKKDIHAPYATELPFFFGFDVGLEMPADEVYEMLKIIEAHAADLARSDADFTQIAKDMPGLQRRGVRASWNLVPIHPGLAKYMREKGVWDTKWDQRVATR